MFKQELIQRLLRFGVVGVTVTLVFMGLNWVFALWLIPDIAYLVAYPLAVGLHFFLSKCWTFGDRGAVRKRQVLEYLGLLVIAFVMQTAVFKLLIHFTAIVPWTAAGIASVAQMALAFLIMQRRVFARSNAVT